MKPVWKHRTWGWIPVVILGAGAYGLPRFWRLVAIAGLVAYEAGWLFLVQIERLTAIVRSQRHWVANRLQVVGGWLELDQVDKAHAALQATSQHLNTASRRDAEIASNWGYILLMAETEAEGKGVACTWDIDVPVPSGWWPWWVFRQVVNAAIAVAAGPIRIRVDRRGFEVAMTSAFGRLPWFWGRVKVLPEGDTTYLIWGSPQAVPPRNPGNFPM